MMSSIDLNFLCGDGGDGRRRGGKTFRAAAGELDNGAIGAGGGQNGNSVDWPSADREFFDSVIAEESGEEGGENNGGRVSRGIGQEAGGYVAPSDVAGDR